MAGRILRKRTFWWGALAGTVAGSWALGKLGSLTGIRIGLPKA